MNPIEMLEELRSHGGTPRTRGLDDADIARFAADPALRLAIEEAVARHRELRADLDDFLKLDEAEQIRQVQAGVAVDERAEPAPTTAS